MRKVLDIIDGDEYYGVQYPPVVVMEIYMELEIMIWIFVVCGDYGDDGDFAI